LANTLCRPATLLTRDGKDLGIADEATN
jgi:hypothetical protein